MKLQRWGPAAVYVVLSAVLLRWFWFKINPDTLAYFAVARHYARGEWFEAVNLGWSPMVSWLMAPLVAAGASDIAALRAITLVSGVLTLFAVRKLGEEFELSPSWQRLTEYTAAIVIAIYSVLWLGPDLLEAALVLLYLGVVLPSRYARENVGWLAGAWGAAAFLTKGYALYFFLGHFALVSAVHGWTLPSDRMRVIKQWAAGMVVFLVLTLPWFGAMAYRAGHLTTGTTGSWNYRLVGPDSVGYPQYFGLIEPVRTHGSSMWEEPKPELLRAWSPLGSGRELKHQLRLIYTNMRMLLVTFMYASILIPGVLLAYAVWSWGREKSRISWVLAMLTLATYPAGYFLILVLDRYVLCLMLLVLLMGARVAQAASLSLRRGGIRILAAGYFLSFLLVPGRMVLAQAGDERWATIANDLQRQVPNLQGNMAGCGGWNDNVQIAWALQLPFYGQTGPTKGELEIPATLNPGARYLEFPKGEPEDTLAEKLRQYRIDYFLKLPACDTVPAAVASAGHVIAESNGARLYRLAAE